MIRILIPSLDRAAQLELLLRSLRENFLDHENLHFVILYKSSTPEFAAGYEKLKTAATPLRVTWWAEKNFEQQVKNFLHGNRGEIVGLLVDDCIFYRPFYGSVSEIPIWLDDDTFCFSLRLGLNTTTQYYATGEQQQPLYTLGFDKFPNGFIRWNWKARPAHSNYGYIFSLDGHFYRADDLYHLTSDLTFHNPRAWESHIANSLAARNSVKRKYFVADQVGHILVNSVNCVSKEKIPSGLLHSYTPEFLNDQYLKGQLICLENDYESVDSGCHCELPIHFIPEKDEDGYVEE